ncbi:Hypothetical protein SMAX5B_021343 [Scophthalmus maximus]|uniref:Uncharacterized protein n=1 Tax=Scophthalmus maximus TaxID=52904 RepID=A0A2U9BLP7_SCOMX|nr:Hypothetical protein SMAX5B_021343 [Scophthalmus maximus]
MNPFNGQRGTHPDSYFTLHQLATQDHLSATQDTPPSNGLSRDSSYRIQHHHVALSMQAYLKNQLEIYQHGSYQSDHP